MAQHQSETYPVKRAEQGFTIIEVLFVIVIFSISLLAIGTLVVSAINGNATARRATEASSWASDRIEKLMAVAYESLDSSPAPIVQGGYSLSWTVISESPLPNVKTVEVTVSNARGNPKEVRFTYYKGKTY